MTQNCKGKEEWGGGGGIRQVERIRDIGGECGGGNSVTGYFSGIVLKGRTRLHFILLLTPKYCIETIKVVV